MRWHSLMLAAGLAGFASISLAAEQAQHRLAFSKRMGVEILAETRDGQWCREALNLEFRARDRELFAREDFRRLMRQIGALIEKDCSEAKTASLTGTSADDPEHVYQGQASKIGRWSPHALKASGEAQQPAAVADRDRQTPKHQTPVAAPKAESPPATTTASVAPPASAAPPAEASQAVAAPPSVPPAVRRLPRDIGYTSALIRLMKDTPSLAQDDGVVRYWAAYRFENEYSRFSAQEFKLLPILRKARTDLAETVAQNDGQRVIAFLSASFGAYNFDTQQFPISLKMDGLDLERSWRYSQFKALPSKFTVMVPDLDVISGLPMERNAAQAFATKRTRYGSVDRSITIAMTIKLDSGGFVKGRWGDMTATGTLESATIFADSQATQPLYSLEPADLIKRRAARAAEKAAIAKAEEERKAEQRRQQMQAQREGNIRTLSSASTSVKLANWVSDGQIDFYTRLNNLRAARAAALVGRKAVMVSMLIQADGSGRNKVDTKWPGKLEITVADGQPDLNSSGWYLVRGLLSVPEGGSLPPAQLAAEKVYACTQPKCADAADPTAIIDRKLAALTAAN